MSSDLFGSDDRRAGHPLVGVLASFPVACFVCALATDVAYVSTAQMMWANFSAWLLAAGLAGAGLAAVAGLVDSFVHRGQGRSHAGWPFVLGIVLVLAVGLLDNLVHSRDAWTSVMPTGLVLSVILVVITLLTVWLGGGPGRAGLQSEIGGEV